MFSYLSPLDGIDIGSQWVIPFLLVVMVFVAYARKVRVYEAFVEGAKEGFNTSVMIIPYLVSILFAIGMFRAGGGERAFTSLMEMTGIPSLIGMPSSTIPLALIRPLSGSGARGVLVDIFLTKGPDSIDGMVGSILMGSTETTFYVLAVYMGSIGVQRTRHAVASCLSGDIAGIVASVFIARWFLAAAGK